MTAHGRLDRLSMVAGVAVMVLVLAACAIKLRGDEDQFSASPSIQDADPLAAALVRCRTVTPEQKEGLAECRRIWAEQRRQFLGQSKAPAPTAHPNDNAPNGQPPASSPRKDKSRLPQGWPSISPSESK
jgi:conjugative transfer region protein TrbK